MHHNQLFYSLLIGLFLFSCAGQSGNNAFGTLKGLIGIYEGNCMPSPGMDPCKPQPISTIIYITKPAKNFEIGLLIDSILTNDEGEFQLKLKANEYSLFIQDGKEIICNGFECKKECYCTPFKIVIDSVTSVSANINHASW